MTIRFVDVGARGGIPEYWEAIADQLHVTAFESDPAEAERLRRDGLTVIEGAAWDSDGTRPFYLTRAARASSLLKPIAETYAQYPEADRMTVEAVETVKTVTIDSALTGEYDWLKIDVQGGELHVLRGAQRILRDLVGLEIEIMVAPGYEGQASIGTVTDFLAPFGFELVDFRPTYWRRTAGRDAVGCKGQIAFVDALFMRSPANVTWDIEKRRKAIACCSVYGLHDYQRAYAAGFPELQSSLTHKTGWTARIPNFRYRLILAHLLKDLGDMLLTYKGFWAFSDQALGNKPRHRLTRWFR